MDEHATQRPTDLAQPAPASAKTNPQKVRNALLKMLAGAGAVATLATATACVMGVPIDTRLKPVQLQGDVAPSRLTTQPTTQPTLTPVPMNGGIPAYKVTSGTPTPKPTPDPNKGEDK